jgi:hypothetical protein
VVRKGRTTFEIRGSIEGLCYVLPMTPRDDRHRPKGEIPPRLLVQIGRIAATSAYIEQQMFSWASGTFSTDAGGRPIEPLWMEFGRLQQKWYRRVVQQLDKKTVDEFVHPLNMTLTRVWPMRDLIIHGRWRHVSGWKYQVDCWEQNAQREYRSHIFTLRSQIFTLRQLREFADELDRILRSLYLYLTVSRPKPKQARKLRQVAQDVS